jgi:hypothetical protein
MLLQPTLVWHLWKYFGLQLARWMSVPAAGALPLRRHTEAAIVLGEVASRRDCNYG